MQGMSYDEDDDEKRLPLGCVMDWNFFPRCHPLQNVNWFLVFFLVLPIELESMKMMYCEWCQHGNVDGNKQTQQNWDL